MEYVNLHVSTIDSVGFQSAEPVEQATWLKLIRFLVGQENGDTIKGAREWTDRTWLRTCNVRLKEVNRPCGLWTWVGDDLQVSFYPHEAEAVIKAKRIGGKNRWRHLQGLLPAEQKGKEGEGNEMEGKGKKAPTAAEIPSDETIADFCAHYQDLSRGIQSIPEVWWRGYLANLLRSQRFPSDWQRCLTNAFTADFVARHPKAVGHPENFQKKIPPAFSSDVPPPPGKGEASFDAMR